MGELTAPSAPLELGSSTRISRSSSPHQPAAAGLAGRVGDGGVLGVVGRGGLAERGTSAGRGLGGPAEVAHLHYPSQVVQLRPGPSQLRRPPVGVRGDGGARGPRPQVVGRHLDAGSLRLVGVL